MDGRTRPREPACVTLHFVLTRSCSCEFRAGLRVCERPLTPARRRATQATTISIDLFLHCPPHRTTAPLQNHRNVSPKMVAQKKTKKTAESINSRLQLVIKSGASN